MAEYLLPPNATLLERATAMACAPLDAISVPLRFLWNPTTCLRPLLPYLAWTLSVDRWDADWSEVTQRRVIQAAFFIHQRKGTRRALRQVLEPLGYRLEIKEWWQCVPVDPPGTFRLQLSAWDQALSEAKTQEIERLIDDVKPVSRHLRRLTMLLASHGFIGMQLVSMDGETLTVYPYFPTRLVTRGGLVTPGTLHLIDFMRLSR